MVARASELLKNPNFLLKIVELVLVLVGFVLVLLQDRFTWPNSLTMVFCIDTGTYTIILSVILLAYVLEQPHQLIELRFTVIGVVVFVIGSILAFRNYEEAQDVSDGKVSMLDFYLGIILSVTAVVMVFDTFLGMKCIGDGMNRDFRPEAGRQRFNNE